ncbi:acyl-CoA dehydrogenase family protein [Streptomyces sp. DSM 42041]|uniref:Acyl-CoA dehydrogenase family protein n=1 Tax=Streptomyces hazeniae TaxID=3075538 RepID=A0ABU2NVA9_9ACTN|nr:acyl-CoA dehydrogenase family protein [Streptomyces sp. DSM 42041]MDT0380556.1 acyl-CoA dehydrogenase family protein [Streptomyces sp. DSM 42041]
MTTPATATARPKKGSPVTGRPTGPAELVARARKLRPLLRTYSAQGENDRRLPENSYRALAEAGLLRLSVPRRFGGYEASLRVQTEVSAVLAEADAGAAWIAAVGNSNAFSLSLFPEFIQEEVFGADPTAHLCGVVAPSGEAQAVAGGWRVTGRWHYASGSWHSGWALLGVPLRDESGATVDHALALVPRRDFTVEDTWYVSGLRSSGSACVVVDDVFVPKARVLSVLEFLAGDNADRYPHAPLYQSSVAPVLSVLLAGPLPGLAREALRVVSEEASTKTFAYTFFANRAESALVQAQVAQAAMKVDSAHMHVCRAADVIDRAAAAGVRLDRSARARIRADIGYVADLTTEAVELLLDAHGAGAFANSHPLQRIWRDLSVAARHAALVSSVGYEALGKAMLGIDQPVSMLV